MKAKIKCSELWHKSDNISRMSMFFFCFFLAEIKLFFLINPINTAYQCKLFFLFFFNFHTYFLFIRFFIHFYSTWFSFNDSPYSYLCYNINLRQVWFINLRCRYGFSCLYTKMVILVLLLYILFYWIYSELQAQQILFY